MQPLHYKLRQHILSIEPVLTLSTHPAGEKPAKEKKSIENRGEVTGRMRPATPRLPLIRVAQFSLTHPSDLPTLAPGCQFSACRWWWKEHIKQRREYHAPTLLPGRLVRHDPAGGGYDGSTRPERPPGPAAEAVRNSRAWGCGGGVGPVYG